MARLVIEVEVEVDPALEDPEVLAEELLAEDTIGPPATLHTAYWSN